MIRYVCRTLVAFLLTFGLSVTTWGLTIESDDFVAEVERLRDLTFDKNTNLYVEPTPAERNDVSTLASTFWAGDIAQADLFAGALNYEIVEFTNTITSDVYHGLRELLVNGDQPLGWGSYFVNLTFNADNLVEVPHPRFDTNSLERRRKSLSTSGSAGFYDGRYLPQCERPRHSGCRSSDCIDLPRGSRSLEWLQWEDCRMATSRICDIEPSHFPRWY